MRVVLFALLMTLASCGESLTDQHNRIMSELDCPIILIGKTEKGVENPSFTVRDGEGRVRCFDSHISQTNHGSSSMPASFADSREIGDTLKPCEGYAAIKKELDEESYNEK